MVSQEAQRPRSELRSLPVPKPDPTPEMLELGERVRAALRQVSEGDSPWRAQDSELGEVPLEADYWFGDLTFTLPREALVAVCQVAKHHPDLAFDYLRCLSAVEYPEAFELVYHLYSMQKGHKLVLKTRLPKDDPVVDSVMGVWRGADWHEREAAEMFGLMVAGHPNLKPLLLDEGVEEHPLLKSHPLVPIGQDRQHLMGATAVPIQEGEDDGTET